MFILSVKGKIKVGFVWFFVFLCCLNGRLPQASDHGSARSHHTIRILYSYIAWLDTSEEEEGNLLAASAE